MRVTVDRPDDERLADYVRLRDASLRKHLEAEHGLFIAEGAKVIRRALAAGYRPRSLLLAERWLADLADVLRTWPDVPVYVVSEALAEEVTGFHVHRGALASMHRVERNPWTDLLTSDRLVVIEDVVDHTNVGAILRNAAALGWDGALLAPRAADPLYRRSIKVSMGAVFSLPWARLPDRSGTPAGYGRRGSSWSPSAWDAGAVRIEQVQESLVAEPRRVAVLLGTEGSGLSRRWLEEADVTATIAHARRDRLVERRRRLGDRLLSPRPALTVGSEPDQSRSVVVPVVVIVVVGNLGRDRPVGGVEVGAILVAGPELLAGPVGQPVAEHDAVQMIGLVLEAAGQQAGADDLDVVRRSRPARGRPRDRDGTAPGTRRGGTDSPRRRCRACGRGPRATSPPDCRSPRRAVRGRRRGSRTRRRRGRRPTWVAASPTPSAAAMVANMSRTSVCRSSSNAVTGRVRACMTGVTPAGDGTYGAAGPQICRGTTHRHFAHRHAHSALLIAAATGSRSRQAGLGLGISVAGSLRRQRADPEDADRVAAFVADPEPAVP